jgi:hypothetical protein
LATAARASGVNSSSTRSSANIAWYSFSILSFQEFAGEIFIPLLLYGAERKLINELSISSRLYAEKYHGLDSGVYFFENIIDFVNGENNDLLNLYHPLSGFYPNRSPKITHPLVNNKIIQ